MELVQHLGLGSSKVFVQYDNKNFNNAELILEFAHLGKKLCSINVFH